MLFFFNDSGFISTADDAIQLMIDVIQVKELFFIICFAMSQHDEMYQKLQQRFTNRAKGGKRS